MIVRMETASPAPGPVLSLSETVAPLSRRIAQSVIPPSMLDFMRSVAPTPSLTSVFEAARSQVSRDLKARIDGLSSAVGRLADLGRRIVRQTRESARAVLARAGITTTWPPAQAENPPDLGLPDPHLTPPRLLDVSAGVAAPRPGPRAGTALAA